MSIKSILCIFGGSPDELNALNTAFALGKSYGAQILVLHISPDPTAYVGMYGEYIIATGAIIEAIEKENAARLKRAKEYVVSSANRYHVPLDEPVTQTHQASVRFQHLVGMIDSTIVREGRLSDLIIMGREGTPTHDLITPALFETGRPVLIVPPTPDGMGRKLHYKTVAFAWNGSLQAARALYNALPVLRRAEKLYTLTVEKDKHDDAVNADVMKYLHAHDIKSQNIIVTAGNDQTIAEAIAMHAKELHADLLVMGAYGHSMFREMVLGGVTKHMLQKAELPLFLSH